jgi:homoserine dehydrogenase
MQELKTALIGLGNVNRNFLRILEMKEERLAHDYGLRFRIVAVSDSSGVAVQSAGFTPAALRMAKESGTAVAGMAGYQPGLTNAEIAATLPLDLVLDGSPVNLHDGEPGMSVLRAALGRGLTVVTANKGPLALNFAGLAALKATKGGQLGYSATLCGALPVVNLGLRDFPAADFLSIRGIFNSTTNFVLAEMENGREFADALAEAQRRGIAETDPTLDVEGWDTANKLVILANTWLRLPVTVRDIEVTGIQAVTRADLLAAQAAGETIKLIASALPVAGKFQLRVAPTRIQRNEFLANCSGWEMGVECHSDLYGRQYFKLWEREPLPTAAAMLRDVVNLLGTPS